MTEQMVVLLMFFAMVSMVLLPVELVLFYGMDEEFKGKIMAFCLSPPR